jgi:hypothetical protein
MDIMPAKIEQPSPLEPEVTPEGRKIIREARKEWRTRLTERKLAKAKVDEPISFTGVSIEGVPYAAQAASKDTMLYRGLEKTQEVFEAFLEKTGIVEDFEPSLEQQVAMRRVVDAFNAIQSRFGRPDAEFPEDNIRTLKGIDQFGVGGGDTFFGNNIYLSERTTKEPTEQFAYTFAHEFAHSLSTRRVKKTKEGTIQPVSFGFFGAGNRLVEGPEGVTEINQPSSAILREGVTDLFAKKAAEDAGLDMEKVELSPGYAPYRQVISDLAERLGESDYDKGLDFLLEAYVTGKDEDLITRINQVYGEEGGYPAFIDLLNHVAGKAGTLNSLEQSMKSQLKSVLTPPNIPQLPRIQFFPLTGDRHFKKLSVWVKGTAERPKS